MSDFDPYYKWLGIPPKDQPPNHYRLLGIELYESDPDVIDAATEQRASFVRQCATGQYLAESQRLLNEIAAARLCLLNAESKTAYDEELTVTLDRPKTTCTQLPTTLASGRQAKTLPVKRVNQEPNRATANARKTALRWGGIFAGLVIAVLLINGLRGRSTSEKSAAPTNVADNANSSSAKADLPPSSAVATSPSTPDILAAAPASVSLPSIAINQDPASQSAVPTQQKPKRLAGEPVFLPIRDLIADSGVVALGIADTPIGSEEVTPRTGYDKMMGVIGRSSRSITARGVRYVVLRGVIPMGSQRQAYAEAMETVDSKQLLAYSGFVLERQAAVSGVEPWAGSWELVNLESFAEVMEYAAGFDEELAPAVAIDPAVTMELPYRLVGNWGNHASHPLVALSESPVLLFRYLDFDVQPGMAYRYRARLKLRNPNFERPPAEIVDPASSVGRERETGWSNISNPAVVPSSVNYFLKDVERDPSRDDKVRSSKPVANFSIFEWDTKSGTMLHDSLKILDVGQFISEKKKSIVIDVAAPSYKDDVEIVFVTGDVLLDASGDFDILPEQHPDLGLRPERGRSHASLRLPEEVVVMTSHGELKVLDPVSEKPKEDQLRRLVDAERQPFLSLKNAPAGAAATSLIRPIPHSKSVSAKPTNAAVLPVQSPPKPMTTDTMLLPKRTEPRPLSYTSTSTGMKFKLIPAGEFRMGSPPTEAGRSENEGPQHTVVLSQPFYMGVYEVTQEEFMKVMGNNPSANTKDRNYEIRISGLVTSRFPVEGVSWYDAIDFCNKLSAKDGFLPYYALTNAQRSGTTIFSADVSVVDGDGYRLPTEAQWEYACRANTITPFHFGSTANGSEASVNGRLPYGKTPIGKLQPLKAVGSYSPNVFGLYDMHGNVGEHCFDVFDPLAYQGRTGMTVDPVNTTPKAPEQSSSRVVRSRGTSNNPIGARSAARHASGRDVGFRVVFVGTRSL